MNLKLVVPFVAALTLFAQSPVPDQVIRVTTRLVEVNVVVRDKNGPVGDLTKDDFTVLDRGKPRSVAFFSVTESHAPRKPAVPLPPNTFTNRMEQRGETVGNVTVVLFDTLNTEWTDQAYAKREIVKFLGKVQPQDRIGIYVLGTSLRVIQDFTNDPQRLINALMRFRGETFFTTGTGDTVAIAPKGKAAASGEQAAAATETSAATTAPPTDSATAPVGVDRPNMPTEGFESTLPDVNAIVDHLNEVISDRMIVDHAGMTMSAMEMIASHIARMPGRKNLIWVSGSFPISIGTENPVPLPPSGPTAFAQAGTGNANREHRVFTRELDSAARALNNANVAVYPVDARGLVGMPGFSAANRSGPVQMAALPATLRPAGQDTMSQIAKFTGGRAFYNTNDIQGAVRAAVEDSDVSYTLGFYPDSNDLDATFHAIKVQVNRKGLDVRYRQGYIADPENQPTLAERNGEIGTALWSALESTGIALTARIGKVDPDRPAVLGITLDVDLNDIALQAKDNHCMLDVVLAQRSADGREISTKSDTLDMKIDPARYEALLKQGLTFRRLFEVAPKATQVRIVVFDRISGRVGSLAMTVGQ